MQRLSILVQLYKVCLPVFCLNYHSPKRCPYHLYIPNKLYITLILVQLCGKSAMCCMINAPILSREIYQSSLGSPRVNTSTHTYFLICYKVYPSHIFTGCSYSYGFHRKNMSKIGPAVSEIFAQFCFCKLIVTVCPREIDSAQYDTPGRFLRKILINWRNLDQK